MNYTIALCRESFSPFHKLGYNIEFMEQTISTDSGEQVKPDIVKASKQFNHIIVFDCKSGTADKEQLARYQDLTTSNLLRWIDTHSPLLMRHDICIVNMEENLSAMRDVKYAMVTFGPNQISLTNRFSLEELNALFTNHISLNNIQLPLSYYPFSDEDEDAVIMPRIIRTLVSVTIKNRRGGLQNQSDFTSDEVLAEIHPFWKVFSTQHKNRLKKRIDNILSRIHGNTEFSEKIHKMREGRYHVRGPTAKFREICETMIRDVEKQSTLDHTMDSK